MAQTEVGTEKTEETEESDKIILFPSFTNNDKVIEGRQYFYYSDTNENQAKGLCWSNMEKCWDHNRYIGIRSFVSEGERWVFVDEIYEFIRLALIKQNKGGIEKLEAYRKQWIPQKCDLYFTIPQSQFGELLAEFDIDDSMLVHVEDPVLQMKQEEAIEEAYYPVSIWAFDGVPVMSREHAMFYMFQKVVCGINWSRHGPNLQYATELLKMKRLFFSLMEQLQSLKPGTLMKESSVMADTDGLLELIEDIDKVRVPNYLHSDKQYDDTIPVALFTRTALLLGSTNFEETREDIPVYEARVRYLLWSLRSLVPAENVKLKVLLAEGLLVKLPAEHRDNSRWKWRMKEKQNTETDSQPTPIKKSVLVETLFRESRELVNSDPAPCSGFFDFDIQGNTYFSSYHNLTETRRKKLKVKYFLFNVQGQQLEEVLAQKHKHSIWSSRTMDNVMKVFNAPLVLRILPSGYVLVDEGLEILRLILKRHGLLTEENLEKLKSYREQWAVKNSELSFSIPLFEYKKLWKEVGLNAERPVVVPDPIYYYRMIIASNCPLEPAATLNYDGQHVMTPGQAMLHTIIILICGINWNVKQCSSGAHAFNVLREKFVKVMSWYSDLENGTLIKLSYVESKIEKLKKDVDRFVNHEKIGDRILNWPDHQQILRHKFSEFLEGADLDETPILWMRLVYVFQALQEFYPADMTEHKLQIVKELCIRGPVTGLEIIMISRVENMAKAEQSKKNAEEAPPIADEPTPPTREPGSSAPSQSAKTTTSSKNRCWCCSNNIKLRSEAVEREAATSKKLSKCIYEAKQSEKRAKENARLEKEIAEMKEEMEQLRREVAGRREREERLRETIRDQEETNKRQQEQLESEQQSTTQAQQQAASLRRTQEAYDTKLAKAISLHEEQKKQELRANDRTMNDLHREIAKLQMTIESGPSTSYSFFNPVEPIKPKQKNPKAELDELKWIKKGLENSVELKEYKETIERLKTVSDLESIQKLCDFELGQLEQATQIYGTVLDMNIARIEKFNDTSDLFPLPKYPKLSEKFKMDYDKEMRRLEENEEIDRTCIYCSVGFEEGVTVVRCQQELCRKVVHMECQKKWEDTQTTERRISTCIHCNGVIMTRK